MKLWIKYCIATVLGIILGIVFPKLGGDSLVFFGQIQVIIIHIGRYILYPLLFFYIVIGTYNLCEHKAIVYLYGRIIRYIIISTVVLTLIATIFIAIFPPARVPIIINNADVLLPPEFSEQILLIFPKNVLNIFTNSGDFIFPLHLFAIFVGIALYYYHSLSNNIINLFEEFSQIFYKINRFVIEVLSIGITFLAVYRIMQIRELTPVFLQFLLVTLGLCLVVLFVIIPIFLYIHRRKNPFPWIFAQFTVICASVLSGDNYFPIGTAITSLNHNTNLDHNKTASMVSFSAVFGRSGVAMITCLSFILILRSYSSLSITFLQYLWVMGNCIFISFLLGAAPQSSLLFSLVYISTWYGQGIQDGYYILFPIIPILNSLAVCIDTIMNQVNCQLAIDKEKDSDLAKIRNYL